jgi:site-specific DNA recombinase
VRRIFDLSAAGTGYSNIAKVLNSEQTLTPRPQQDRPAGWGPSSVHAVLHRPLYHGEIVWGKTKKRDAEGTAAARPRPETDWLRLDKPELRIISDDLWDSVHRRLGTARATYARQTHGRRTYRRDQDSKYLLTGFGRCAVCGGGLHVRSRRQNSRGDRAFFYACTSHYSKGPTACPHVDQWPMAELDHEVRSTLAEDVLAADVADEVISAARVQHVAAAQADRTDQLRRDLAAVERELTRLTDAVAGGAGQIPALVERMRRAETKRRAILAELQQTRQRRPAPAWNDIERKMRSGFATGERACAPTWRPCGIFSGSISPNRCGSRQPSSAGITSSALKDASVCRLCWGEKW